MDYLPERGLVCREQEQLWDDVHGGTTPLLSRQKWRLPVGLGAYEEIRSQFAGYAKQFVNVAFPIANMDAPARLIDQGIGLTDIFKPAETFFCLDGYPGGIDLPFQSFVPLNLSRVQNLAAVSPSGTPFVVNARLECNNSLQT